ncbi:peptidase S24 [Calidifontibacter sp. DB0510]|uniref:Peptidase S24 n=2 Tax=Metallococcus carri TaxID=1656884 RepID=A0A967EAZ3_9MICO|nr:peptidase S24 [Metallococcus carri]NOP36043.1 peptidase S24 [Calidifontibacter sp. DB2511S]
MAVVRGRSMEPTYRDGDRVLVRYAGRPRPGRAALVRLPPGPDGPRPLAIKRLGRHTPEGWWIERDNPREGVDSWAVGAIPQADVVAIVLCTVPRVGFRPPWR